MRLRCINAVGLSCGFSPEEPYGFLRGILAGALMCRNNWLLSGSSTQMMSVSAGFRPADIIMNGGIPHYSVLGFGVAPVLGCVPLFL